MRTLVRHCLVLSLLALCLPEPQAGEVHVAKGIDSMPGTKKKIDTAEVAATRPMLIATETQVVRADSAGKVVWRTPSGVSRDVWQLPNGNVLFPFNQNNECGVREVTPAGKTAWEFRLPGQYVISCQRMKGGNTLVGASCQGAVLVVNPAGEVIHRIKMRADHKKHSTTIVRELANGNILVVEESSRFVAEYTLAGERVWEMKTPFPPFGAARLPNGNTLISGRDGIIEATPGKQIVWRLTKEDVQEVGPRWFAGFRILPNGNIVVCNAGGKVLFFEVNRQKQVVWRSTLTKAQLGSAAHGFDLVPVAKTPAP